MESEQSLSITSTTKIQNKEQYYSVQTITMPAIAQSSKQGPLQYEPKGISAGNKQMVLDKQRTRGATLW